MNEKERIIELVRQNIITMDEALRLLEAGQTTSSEPEVKASKSAEQEAEKKDRTSEKTS